MRAWAFRFIWLFAFTLTWEESVVLGSVSLTRVVGLIALGLGLSAVIVSGRMKKPHPAQFVMLGYLSWVVVTYLFSSRPEQSFPDIILYLQLVGVAFLVYEFVQDEREQASVLQAFVLGSVISIVTVLMDLASGGAQAAGGHHSLESARYQAAVGPNSLAVYLSLSMCVALYLTTVRKERAWIWFNTCIVPPTMLAIFLTGSRGGLITLMVALLIIPAVVLTRAKAKRQLLVIGAIAVMTALVLTAVPGQTWERLSTTGDEILHGTLTGRTAIWRAGLKVFGDHPIAGSGTGTFAMEVAPMTGTAIVAHNVYLEVLAEQGIVGFGLFAAMIIALVLPLGKLPIPQRNFWVILFGVFLVGAMDLSLGRKKILWFILGMIAARVASARTQATAPQQLPLPQGVLPRVGRMGLPARFRVKRRSLNSEMEKR
jgi:O-antigen ligase